MKLIIIGSGGRENAIAWKIAQNANVEKIYCIPGNGGTNIEEKCENVKIDGINNIADFAEKNAVELTIVGPEVPLSEGIVDLFNERKLKIFGPTQKGALLESSKVYSKNFMKKYKVKTAAYEAFEDSSKAIEYLKECEYPVVIKADGLAAGKGVVICNDYVEAKDVIDDFMIKDIFKGSGRKIIIEEFLEGVEASILSICDGDTIIPFITAKDHKQIYDGGIGPNTGGMGAIAPNPYCSEDVLREFEENIMKPTLEGLKGEKIDYIGIIFFGIMITKKGVLLLEYNVRMGDPETQAVLPLMKSDLVELIESAIDKKLRTFKIEWYLKHCCSVVAASEGYPASYKTGHEITGINKLQGKAFIAGAEYINNKLLTSGGRVLCVSDTGCTLKEAKEKAYKDIENISFDGIYYRKDIGNID